MERNYLLRTRENGIKKCGQDGGGGRLTLNNPGDTWLVQTTVKAYPCLCKNHLCTNKIHIGEKKKQQATKTEVMTQSCL